MIDYVFKKSHLVNSRLDAQHARAVNVRSCTENDLADEIVRRNMGISKPEALALIEALTEIQLEWIAEGKALNLRMANFHYTIPGAYGEGEFPQKAIVRVTPGREATEAARKNARRRTGAVADNDAIFRQQRHRPENTSHANVREDIYR